MKHSTRVLAVVVALTVIGNVYGWIVGRGIVQSAAPAIVLGGLLGFSAAAFARKMLPAEHRTNGGTPEEPLERVTVATFEAVDSEVVVHYSRRAGYSSVSIYLYERGTLHLPKPSLMHLAGTMLRAHAERAGFVGQTDVKVQ